MITIYDIAKKCKVSSATVSKALNDLSDVAPKTKLRIKNVAEELGYSPNVQARTLSTKKSYIIGIIFTDDKFQHPFWGNILEHIRRELEGMGYDMVFLSKNLKGIRYGYLEHCRWRSVDGVILVSVNFDTEDIKKLLDSEIPCVLIDKESLYGTSIMSQNYEGTKRAVEYLVKCGHEKIGFVNGGTYATYVTRDRICGFKEAMAEAQIAIREEWMKEGGYYQAQKTYKVVKSILALKERPTALLLPDDSVASACYQAANELGLKVPDDISFIGHDGLALDGMIKPSLTTIAQDMEQIGKVAASQVVRIANTKKVQKETIFIPTTLVEKESVRHFR
jgi:Transcriptional regulators